MKKLSSFVAVLICISCLCVTAFADSGPKPSITVSFPGETGEIWVTLLSKEKSTGPYSYDYLNNRREECEEKTVFDKLVSYTDTDGFYFLGFMGKSSASSDFKWSYYPPSTFKILIYHVDTDSFETSEILERYAFNSYFVYENGKVTADYRVENELLHLLARIAVTVAIEIALAFVFGFRGRQAVFILITNVVTQTLLTVAVNLSSYFNGDLNGVSLLVIGEIAVFTAESLIYSLHLSKRCPENSLTHRKWFCALYGVAANAASLVLGFIIL